MSPSPTTTPLIVMFGSHTDVGKRRSNNEDSFRAEFVGDSSLLVVSDGVGGATAGEVASRMAVDGVHELLRARLSHGPANADRRPWIDETIRELDRRIRAKAVEQPDLEGMGATLSLLWVSQQTAWWGQAGDSRIYLWRKDVLQQISQDQSPVGRLRADGKLTEDQARSHPYRHLIDQCLGGGGANVEPVTGTMPVEENDVFLLCSDGLSDGLWDKEIGEGLQPVAAGLSPTEAARQLVERAKEASGKDNITAVVGHVQRAPARTRSRGPWQNLLGKLRGK